MGALAQFGCSGLAGAARSARTLRVRSLLLARGIGGMGPRGAARELTLPCGPAVGTLYDRVTNPTGNLCNRNQDNTEQNCWGVCVAEDVLNINLGCT